VDVLENARDSDRESHFREGAEMNERKRLCVYSHSAGGKIFYVTKSKVRRTNMKKLLLAATIFASCAVPSMAKSLADAVQEQAPAEQHCIATGTVYRLNPRGVNNLSVRTRPRVAGPQYEKDELFTGEAVCVTQMDGVWAFVIYHRDGRAFSGWVHGAYIHLDDTQVEGQ
jgi:hypothetical protein